MSGIFEFMPQSFRQDVYPELVANPSLLSKYPVVRCRPPKEIFSMLGVRKGLLDLDIWVLDIEGAELEALQGTNFDEVYIKVICMECDKHDIDRDQKKIRLLNSNGYNCTIVKRNCMCFHNDFTPSIEPPPWILLKNGLVAGS